MSYGEYEFGDFAKIYDSGPSDGLVGFAEGFADSFTKTYTAARAARIEQEDELFKLKVESEIEREKAAAKRSGKSKDYRTKAANIAALYPGVTGVEAFAFKALTAGQTTSALISDLNSARDNGTFRVNGKPIGNNTETEAAPEVAPEVVPKVKTDETSSLESQTNTVLSSSSKFKPENGDLLMSEISTEGLIKKTDNNLAFEPYQEAGIGSGWMERVRQNRINQRESRANARFEKWKEITGRNVTSPSGLTANNNVSPTITTEVDVATNDGAAPLDTVAQAVGVLTIAAKDPNSSKKTLRDRVDLTKVDNQEKALAAKSALALEDQNDPEVIAMITQVEKLQKELQLFPDIGDMNENQLNEFINTANDNPKYANVSPTILGAMITRANDYQTDILNKALPALTFGTAQEGEAILAELKGKNITTSKVYKDTLNSRIAVLKDLELAKEQKDFVFDENSLKTLAFNTRKEIYADDDLYKTQEAKDAAWALWQSTEGKALLDIYNMTDEPKVPTSFAELSVSVLMDTDEWKNAKPDKQQEMVAAAKALFNGSKSKTLTRANLSAEHAEASLALTSDDPKVREEAYKYLKNIYPVKLASIVASEAGGNDQTYAVTTEPGLIVSATQSINNKGETVYTDIATGKVIENPKSIQTEELDKSRAAAVRGASNLLKDQSQLMGAAANVATMGYKLEELARRNPYVLNTAGKANSLFTSGRRELTAMFKILGNANGDASINEGTLANQITDYLDEAVSNGLMNEETASVYQQFMGASIQYIFAAGKALGQEGNGFSNQDYKNIRNSLLTSNSVETFAASLQRFARDRLDEASRAAVTLRDQTLIKEARSYGAEFGNELNTAEEYFANIRKTLTNRPDTYGWAQGTVKIEVQNVNPAPEVVTKGTVDLIQPGEGLTKFNAQTIANYKAGVGEKPSQGTIDKALLSLTDMGYKIEYIKQEMPFLFPAADTEQE